MNLKNDTARQPKVRADPGGPLFTGQVIRVPGTAAVFLEASLRRYGLKNRFVFT
jgi:hypothetical protein